MTKKMMKCGYIKISLNFIALIEVLVQNAFCHYGLFEYLRRFFLKKEPHVSQIAISQEKVQCIP